jgi:hypothetical protein
MQGLESDLLIYFAKPSVKQFYKQCFKPITSPFYKGRQKICVEARNEQLSADNSHSKRYNKYTL